ncbi:putative disease resistance RPP13-like protein 1 isoform X3 [Triticum urartu]|uniref:putative disease resistance RPP13-like protein 1 isoform X3 n=1 Tax=Triticum urartu TaxID=4572 RepID=UPI002043A087|nr:putative disease resistance RPP13-like protein 1 isoform X3 [Triticum urartu]
MAQLGGLIASALLKVVGDQIGSVLGGQIKLRRNFDNDLRRMKETLECVEAVLLDAERRAITDNEVRLWLKRLKDAMYAISDMLDDSEAGEKYLLQVSRKKKLAAVIPFLTTVHKIKMANKMKTMREHVAEITAQHKAFNLMPGAGANKQKVTDTRVTTSSTLQAQIIGRTDEEEKILASVSKGITEQITFLPIYGKTSQDTNREMIHIALQKLFAEKQKILIVLDDLWEGSDFLLDDLKAMLMVEKASKVVVILTTRNEGIAKKMSTRPHKLAPLTNDMCWTIIKQKSGFEDKDDKAKLEQIGMDIAMKCGGVGLAAQSLGYMLNSMPTSHEWESVRESDIWTLSASDSEDTPSRQVIASLRLSYSSMPSYLKLCFAYCAIFPKGHKIVKDDLICQWISLDFIKPTRTSSSHQLGEKYITELLGLSFLEHSKSSLTARVHPDDVTLFTMHDLVHDLARSVMDGEILVASEDGNLGGSNCHFALLDDCNKRLESPRIRALHFMDSAEIGLHDAAFASAKSLRVLDLSQCCIHKLPDSIDRSKRLRYLNAPGIHDATIPNSITSLSKLNYLSLRDSSNILTLPQSIGEIEGLMYLDLSGCSGMRELPKSFGELKKLVHLDLSKCVCVCNVSEFLGSLTELQYLNLSGCRSIGNLHASLGVLSELQYLNLSFSSYVNCRKTKLFDVFTKVEHSNLSSSHSCLKQLPEVLGNLNKLKFLNLSGSYCLKELSWLSGNQKSLVHLDLSKCRGVNYIPEAFAGFTNLQYLNLSACLRYRLEESPVCQIDRLIDHISTLSNLEHLDLSNNGDAICSLPESLGNLRKLHTLDLSHCNITKIPESIGTIDSLKMLYFKGCWLLSNVPQLSASSISLPLFGVHAGDGKSSSNLVLLQGMNPVELKIIQLEKVKSAEEAMCIKLMEKERLQDLTLRWTEDAQRFVDDEVLLEKLEPPSSLTTLIIQWYNGVRFPSWLSQLPNLTWLALYDMKHLEEWSASDSSGANDLRFPKLDCLYIKNCPNLRMQSLLPRAKRWYISKSDNALSSWGECTMSDTSSPSLVTTQLAVADCELPLHQWRLLGHLSGLTELRMERCGDLTGTPEIIQHLSSLNGLSLTGKEHEELPKWLGELTSLERLCIDGYRGIKELDESIRKLTKLQELKLYNCNSMSSLPHWLTELTYLNTLVINFCEGIRSLPESIEKLTNLKKLKINCPHLKR